MTRYDVIVIGAGAAGIMAAITCAKNGASVLLLEKLPKIAAKLKATGGGKCNLTNTLSNDEFMAHFGRDGKFMSDALKVFDRNDLIEFFDSIGVKTHAPDGFRIFPTTHNSTTILKALESELKKQKVKLLCEQRVEKLLIKNSSIYGVKTDMKEFHSSNVILATGGLGYPSLGAEGDGYRLSREVGHNITDIYPAMTPLNTKEKWVSRCTADTIAKVHMRVDMKKHKKLKAVGDLIFTKSGIRGPVVLDFAREITPLCEKYGEVPVLLNVVKGQNEQQIRDHLKEFISKSPDSSLLDALMSLISKSLSLEICNISKLDANLKFLKLLGRDRDKIIKTLLSLPLTITGTDGFDKAMITRGGVSLKEIDPKSMQSKIIKGLYFCGEVMNLDGPCGGYNLQWSFSSGYLAGVQVKRAN